MSSSQKLLKRALADALDRLDCAASGLRRMRPGSAEYERALLEAERLHADVKELMGERRNLRMTSEMAALEAESAEAR
jgi:hypothetical protein